MRMSRFEALADLYLYPTEQSGKTNWVWKTYRPLGFLRRDPVLGFEGDSAYGLFFELGETPLHPGQTRRTNLNFLIQESLDAFKKARKFYVWDGGRLVGEVSLVEQ